MNDDIKTLMESLYEFPEEFWNLSEERQKAVLQEMQETLEKLLELSEQSFNNLSRLFESMAGYAKFVTNILNS